MKGHNCERRRDAFGVRGGHNDKGKATVSNAKDRASEQIDELTLEQCRDVLNYLVGWVGPLKILQAIRWQQDTYPAKDDAD